MCAHGINPIPLALAAIHLPILECKSIGPA
jgi:hypothetical protein